MKSFLITSVTFLHPVLCIVVELPDCNCGMEVNPMELGDDTVPRFPWIVAICEDIYELDWFLVNSLVLPCLELDTRFKKC